MLKFRKMHGLGNDFVIVDVRDGTAIPTSNEIRTIADRRLGVGCDQLATIEALKDERADIYMGIYNADGSEAEACGNVTRCVADIIMRELDNRDAVLIQTRAGLLPCTLEDDARITVDMGAPQNIEERELPYGRAVTLSVGNPHCVFFVDSLTDYPVEEQGKVIEHHELFPNRTNVEFVEVLSPTHLKMRVWERGSGETMACGSGACAVAIAAVSRGLSERKVRVSLPGGDLDFYWRESDDHILMTGPVAYVFEGIISASCSPDHKPE